MCGIAGYIHFDSTKSVNPSTLKMMTDCMVYRGPDAEGFFLENNIALGHRRLSILDLDLGAQPMLSDDKNYVLVYNGEIYNYIELREELINLGYNFVTNSDTEVIINAYRAWGYDCQNKFNGMWAFALYDKIDASLFLSRDRIGEKPMHYAVHNNTFVFGSELKCLFAYGIEKEIRLELTEIYLALTNIPAPDTFYKNCFKLKPAHYLIVKNGNVVEKKYWELPQINEEKMITDKKIVYKQFEDLFKDAVRIRMRCDVAFGAFLSGGLDSSSVVSAMSEVSKFPVNTFTIGFNTKDFDESELAQEVATKFKTKHFLGEVEPAEFQESIKKISHHFDEPFGDSSAIPTDTVSKHASKQVKMVLTGDGGDEVLSGYNSYKAIKITNRLKRFLPAYAVKILTQLIAITASVLPNKHKYKLIKLVTFLKASKLPFEKRIAQQIAFTDLESIKTLTRTIKNVIPIETYFETLLKDCTYTDDFYKLMYVHYYHSLPNDFLVKVDRMSMANSIETRVPFLDYRLIEFMVKVHKDVKLQGLELKSILRNTIGKTLPENLLHAPKLGFSVPLREWFKDKSFEVILKQNLTKVNKLLDESTIAKIVEENNSGKKDNGNFIWTLILLNEKLND